MILTRRALLVGALGATISSATAARGGLRLADFGGGADGSDASDAFARALAAAAENGAEILLDEGTTRIVGAPGAIVDAAAHDCPEVRHRSIRIRGLGARRSRLLCQPRPTAANPSLPVSRPILKSVGAEVFSLAELTLDGGMREPPRGLRQGRDPAAAALVEVRGARRCEISGIVVTGFAGHWDERDPIGGGYGRRGPLLLADCGDVRLDRVTLEHPTFREGLFVHDARRVVVRGFRLSAVDGAARLSTPLHVIGPRTGTVEIEDLVAGPGWSGSLLNLGGPGHFALRRIRADGGASRFDPERGADPRSPTGGKGIDVGAEINGMLFPGQAATESVGLEDVVLDDVARYAIKATRDRHCPLRRLTLAANVRARVAGTALDAAFVDHVEGAVTAERRLGAAAGLPGILLRDCGGGVLAVDLTEGSEGVTRGDDGLSAAARARAGFGVIRLRTGGLVLAGRIAGFSGGALLDDVAPGEDGLHDAVIEGLAVTMPGAGARPALRLGRGPQRRLRVATVRHCRIDGEAIASDDPRVEIHALRVDG